MIQDSNKISRCPCGSDKSAQNCCLRYIDKQSSEYLKAPSPEALMRSRYSAYVIKDYDYIYQTYAQAQKDTLSIESLKAHDENTHFKRLEVLNSGEQSVEFKAFHLANGDYYCMHETSSFVLENSLWKYQSGIMQTGTGKVDIGRNSPCLCDSGKKFKRCCYLKS